MMKKLNKEKRKNMGIGSFKKNNAITLIALMITVIVLLILAGVTLSLTLGERGIFKTATDAKIRTERAEIIEQAKLDIVDKQTENMGKFTESELVEILNKYGTLSDNGEETILDKTLTSTDKLHEIKVSEIWNVPFENTIIKFTLSGRDYTARKGETWAEWMQDEKNLVDASRELIYFSKYPDKSAYISAGHALGSASYVALFYEGFGYGDDGGGKGVVKYSDEIHENEAYHWDGG